MKYSINGTGNIVAERDIYSLGGFIPKGTVGGKIASESQLSQDGECWLAGGDISGRPDIVIKDNAYVGNFVGTTGMHTDGVTEFSGNTLIPGKIIVRNPIADPINNFYAKDSFIGVSMDVLCGQEADTTAFPFEQGGFNRDVPAGTLFTSASMHTDDANICRTTANLCLGKDTYLYIPTGYNCRVFWGYRNTAGQLAYSGESFAASQALTKLEHPTYKLAMVHITRVNGTAMTPANLLATGAKILGHISSSVNINILPESASGQYVMDKSSFLMNTDNFGLNTVQMRFLAGSMYDTTMYTKTDRPDYKPYGTFRNVERLEYAKYLSDSHRTAATRDTYISAYDCPLLRVDNTTYNDALAAKGDLVLRRCIVPKGIFTDNIHNGNVYEDIDFSYASDHLGAKAGNNFDMWSSHKQGEYAAIGAGTAIAGLISRPENLAAGSILGPGIDSIPLDGSLLELGGFANASIGAYFETGKAPSLSRVRTGKPIKGGGPGLPTVPEGWRISSVYHLDENLNFMSGALSPMALDPTKPYFLALFGKNDGSDISVSDVVALNLAISIYALDKVPEITGSAYVGAGCTVRGDVQLHGDPYVNRLLDVNMWERGTASQSVGKSWEDSKISTTLGNRFRLMDTFPVEPGGLITCNSGYWVECGFFDSNGIFISSPGWGRTSNYVPAGAAYAGIVVKKATSASEPGGLIEDSDIPLANVKYLRAFKKRRYITNELDRTSPEDILLGPDYWEQGYLDRIVGKTYEVLKSASSTYVRLRRPVNTGKGAVSSHGGGFGNKDVSFDAITKCVTADDTIVDGTPLYGATVYKAPSAAITPSEIANSRLVLEFVPQPRIIVPYGSATMFISGPKIRMYDNAVLSRNFNHDADIILQGDAVMGYDFSSGDCLCSNGHDDAIIKLP